jgi:hypothetical protein
MTGSLEILDIFSNRTYLENTKFPSWATDWSCTREEFTISPVKSEPLTYHGSSQVQFIQETALIGQLKLRGVRIASRILSLNAENMIEHTDDRQGATSFKTLLRSYDTRQNPSSGDEVWRYSFWRYVFLSIMEIDKDIVLLRRRIKRSDISRDFAQYIAGPDYVSAKIESHPELPLKFGSYLQFLVPRNAALDDIVVAFHGSAHSHLLRPLLNRAGYYRYLGPIAGLHIRPSGVKLYNNGTPEPLVTYKFRSDLNSLQEDFILV